MSLFGGFSRGSSVSPTLSFRRCPVLTSITLFGSQYLCVKSRPNLFTHSLAAVFSTISDTLMQIEVTMEQRRNARAGDMGDNRENPSASCIGRHDPHMRKSGSNAAGNRTRFALEIPPPLLFQVPWQISYGDTILDDIKHIPFSRLMTGALKKVGISGRTVEAVARKDEKMFQCLKKTYLTLVEERPSTSIRAVVHQFHPCHSSARAVGCVPVVLGVRITQAVIGRVTPRGDMRLQYSSCVYNYLDQHFRRRWIGRGDACRLSCSPPSPPPSQTPHHLMWSRIKNRVYETPFYTTDYFASRIKAACETTRTNTALFQSVRLSSNHDAVVPHTRNNVACAGGAEGWPGGLRLGTGGRRTGAPPWAGRDRIWQRGRPQAWHTCP
ncbi:hypothetical protein PR048_004167 [Dryococelus australis]|uniref:Uncharacterized protein n=1 Tax=Dryococelus australis TaxID=614101 RepID=A0ABQ9I5W7_9NEOP|nr:hypothetical protein PR048_004167 [Dryococelus australis]